ncbi:hypothetical protein VNO78_08599 [Psophocarpus tetragonolobus]|uniref:Uncharacterized protein n=1 Tax=Psophocarpus tetragonolobus TaxID=3891 RepID=A0AAN9SV93_PSOTE
MQFCEEHIATTSYRRPRQLSGAWRVLASTHQNLPLQATIFAKLRIPANGREEDNKLSRFFKFNISSFSNIGLFSARAVALPFNCNWYR